jgi:two-component system, cell cycle sensor histidine kinase and response regulator CckA
VIPSRSHGVEIATPSEGVFRTSDSETRFAPTAVHGRGAYVLPMPPIQENSLALALSTFVLECHTEPVIVLDGAGDVRALNRAARHEHHRNVLEFFQEGSGSDRVRAFVEKVRRLGRASTEIGRAATLGAPGPFVLEGFAVEEAIVVTAHDQNKHRALEEELRQLRRIESLGLVTASVIHDFNNLMTPMLALSSTLASELRASSRSLELVADIESIANRTAALFRDMITIAKPKGRAVESLSLREVVWTMQPLLERIAGHEVALVVDVEDDAILVSVERSRLEHSLLNLVANARQAMPEGGTITISAARAHRPDSDAAPASVLLVVSDTGVGMTEDVRSRACDDFFTTRDTAGGTGLGLASVRRFVTESGGHITLDSEPGRGTSVTIRLPEAPPEPTTS